MSATVVVTLALVFELARQEKVFTQIGAWGINKDVILEDVQIQEDHKVFFTVAKGEIVGPDKVYALGMSYGVHDNKNNYIHMKGTAGHIENYRPTKRVVQSGFVVGSHDQHESDDDDGGGLTIGFDGTIHWQGKHHNMESGTFRNGKIYPKKK
jgi:hypothetical protein